MRPGLNVKDRNACELAGTCPYCEGLFDMPEEYREQYCRHEYKWCGRYLTYVAMEGERQARFAGGVFKMKPVVKGNVSWNKSR